MTRFLPLAALLLLSACIGPFARHPRTPYKFGDKGDLVDFNYAWPAEASRIPALEKRLRGELDAAWRKALAAAVTDRTLATAAKRDFRGHQFAFDWNSAGQSRRLLSLEGRTNSFTGGAHPNHGSAALLWDRRTATTLAPSALLGDPARLSSLIHSRYCAALDRERAKRRGNTDAAPQFKSCPKLTELSLVPLDSNANARFDRLRITADPYVAGPYVEGFYRIDLPLTAAFLAALKPGYRSSFERAQPQ